MAGSKQPNNKVNRVWSLPNGNGHANHPLSVLAQYPILEHVVAHLRPKDLASLANTCQTSYELFNLDNQNSLANMMTKTLCPGKGLATLKECHQQPRESSFIVYNKCGGEDEGLGIESHPCVLCGVNTCDECRMHVTYQTMIEEPGLFNMRWWAGYVFLYPFIVRLMPPMQKGRLVKKKWGAPADE